MSEYKTMLINYINVLKSELKKRRKKNEKKIKNKRKRRKKKMVGVRNDTVDNFIKHVCAIFLDRRTSKIMGETASCQPNYCA